MTILTSVDSGAVSAGAGAVVALVVTLLTVPLTIRLARRLGIVDEPGARSSHVIATPRLGGIGVAVGALAGLATVAVADPTLLGPTIDSDLPLGLVLGLGALLFGCIGLADDLLRGIPVSVRLVAQLAVGAAIVAPWVLARGTEPGTTASAAILVLAATAAVWVIGYVNAFNFMDGVDGMSGFVAIVVGLDLALVGALDDRAPLVAAGLVLAGAAAGFLPLNLRPATVFLGDGGSYFLGAWIATAVVIGIGLDVPPEAVVAVTAPYLADTATTLVRRVVRRDDWRASHHEHAYQQLIELGRSHRSVSATVAGASALCAALGLVSLTTGAGGRVLAALAVVAVAVAYVASPGLLRRRPIPSAPPTDVLDLAHPHPHPHPDPIDLGRAGSTTSSGAR
jgi:UDP-N-acetylmuramyl pentapeptide phosphotransferase/UDP-N-acetylglucosamine-1-phosphate transferase